MMTSKARSAAPAARHAVAALACCAVLSGCWEGEPADAGTVEVAEAATATAVAGPMAATAALTSGTGFDLGATGCSYPTGGTVVTWDVAALYGSGSVTQAAIKSAVTAANTYFASNPNTTIVLKLKAGTWNIGAASGALPGVNLNNLNSTRPANSGWLVIQGAGMGATKLVFTEYDARGFNGGNVNRLAICDMQVTRADPTVSQGDVIGFLQGAAWSVDTTPTVYGDQTLATPGTLDTSGANTKFMVVRIHSGFPSPHDILDQNFGQGRYIRKYGYDPAGKPFLVQDGNGQVSWEQNAQLPNGDWVLGLGPQATTYAIGDKIGIKSKKVGDMMWFSGGGNILVENVLVRRGSRMLMRYGIDHVRFTNVGIFRDPPVGGRIPFLSTSEGGPQIGDVTVAAVSDITFEKMHIEGPGDDGLGIFNVNGLSVTDSVIEDSFARGILLDTVTTTPCIRSTAVDRSPIMTLNGAFAWGCQVDSTAPSAPTGLAANTSTAGRITLTWTGVGAADLDGYRIFRRIGAGPLVEIVNGVPGTAYHDIAVKPGVTYTYTVQAFDTSRNSSASSSSVSATAP